MAGTTPKGYSCYFTTSPSMIQVPTVGKSGPWITSFEKPPVLCHACQLGKHVRLSFVSSNTVVTSCFDLIHSDAWTSPYRVSQGLNTIDNSQIWYVLGCVKTRSKEKKFRNESWFDIGLEDQSGPVKQECMDDEESRVAKEMKLFDALEHKSVVIEVGNQKFAIFTKAPLRAFSGPFMSIGFMQVSISDYGRKKVNDVNLEIHGVKFKVDFVVLDYTNEGNLLLFVLGLFTEDEATHQLFGVHFGKLEVDERQFDHREYWTKVGKPTLTNHKEVLIKEPLMRIVHKLIVGSWVHRLASREICQKRDLWMMSALEESRGVNLAWIIADHLYKHASGTKECPEPIYYEYWTTKMLAEELDEKNKCLLKETGIPTQAGIGSNERQGKENVALRKVVSAARQEGLPPGWELNMIVTRQKFLHHSSANSWQWDLHSSGSGNTLHWQWELILPVGTLSWQ
nr:ribonuclease H-like domain-containing protein [Tanacetum cinerariifolium]